MPVPSTLEIRGPLLEVFKDEAPHNFVISELLDIIAEKLDADLSEMSSTEKTAFKNNINDALKYLLKNKLLRHPSKTTYLISKKGSEILADAPEIIDDDYLKTYNEDELSLTEKAPATKIEIQEEPIEESQTPEPTIEESPEPEPEAESGYVEEQDDIFFAQNQNEEFDESEFDEDIDPEENEEENESEELEGEEPESEESESEEPQPKAEIESEETENGNEDLNMNETELNTTLEAADQESEETEEVNDETETEDYDEETEQAINDSSDLSIEEVLKQYNDDLADQVLEKIESLHQDNFCMLVMDLLSKMGYRVFQTARYTNEAEGSDLIQGIILENKPGMNPIYIQARKLSSSKTVSKADMLDFVSALSDKGGKGMFVTTGKFAKSAEQAARDEGIMLVDGKKLSGLMISNNFCVNTEKVFELKAFDSESFDEYAG